MWIYLTYFLFCSYFVLSQYNSDELTRKRFSLSWFFLLLVTVIFLGFRQNVGGDWDAYLNILEYQKNKRVIDCLFSSYPAYSLLNWIGFDFYGDIQFVNTVCAIIFVGCIFFFCRKQRDPLLTFIFAVPYLILVVGMGYTRQSVAIAIIMVALLFLAQRELLKFFTLVIFAALFHKTALIFLFLAFFFIKSRLMAIFILFFIGLVYVIGYFDDLICSYLDDQLHSSGAFLRGLILGLSGLIFIFCRKYFLMNKDQIRLWSIVSLISFLLCLLGFIYKYSTVADRLGLYLFPLQILVFARLPYVLKFNNSLIYAYKIIAIVYNFFVLYFWLTYSPYSHKWIPYKSYLIELSS